MQDKKNQSSYVITYIIILCMISALILATTSEYLKPLQKNEKESSQYKQLLISCKILNYEGFFQILDNDHYIPARFDKKNDQLIKTDDSLKKRATKAEINAIYNKRIIPMLTTDKGDIFTFKQAGINYTHYIEAHYKNGFSKLHYKLFYLIKGTTPNSIDGYILPINGYGLWDALYGYLSLKPDGIEILGITFYDQKETPGLGAIISDPSWQEQFEGKTILYRGKDNTLSIDRSVFMLSVDKPAQIQAMNVYEHNNAVVAISGATITSKGVEQSFRTCLKGYAPFLLNVNKERSN